MREQSAIRRASETAADVVIGGGALAAEKGNEAVRKLAKRGSRVLRRGERAAREQASEVVHAARTALDSDARTYEDRTRDELYELAAAREIDGRSSMTKDQLIRALRARR